MTLAHNLRYYRKGKGISQSGLAEVANISFRLIQDIEAGKGNPTLDTIGSLAKSLKITATRLLNLDFLRISETETGFLKRYKTEFKSAKIAVALRSFDGMAIWGNAKTEFIWGKLNYDDGKIDVMPLYSKETRGILKTQLNAERRGIALPYTIFHANPTNGDQLYLRCHPTLILNKTGEPLFTSVYVSEIDSDCEENYYDYVGHLFNCVRDTK